MKKYAGLLIVDAIVAILVPVFIEYGPYVVDKWIEVIIGLAIFNFLLAIEILYHTVRLAKEKITQETLVLAKGKITPHLKELSENYDAVVQSKVGDHDTLFEDLLWQDLIDLCGAAKTAANESVIKVKDHHFRSHSSLENIFKDSSTSVYREIYVLDEESGGCDYIYRNFFKMIAGLVHAKEIEVKTLFIRIADVDFENTEFIQKLLRYYYFTKGFFMKVISQIDLDNLRKEFRVGRDWKDFGIYGDYLIFKTQSYDPKAQTEGIFSKNKEEVSKCIKFFDKAWKDASKIQPKDKQKIDLNDVIGKN